MTRQLARAIAHGAQRAPLAGRPRSMVVGPRALVLLNLTLLALLFCATARPAQAQLLDQYIAPNVPGVQVEPDVTVNSRQRSDYEALGVRVGSFMIRPEVNQSLGYDDNVLGRSNSPGSFLEQTQASVQARSDLSQYGIAARVGINDSRYLDQPRQNQTDWNASIDGYYNIGRDRVSLGYAHVTGNQNARNLDTPQLDAPISYSVDTVRLSYAANINRLTLRPEFVVSRYGYDNGTVNGQVYQQKYRDRTVYAPGVVAAYELAPSRRAVFVVRSLVSDYDRAPLGGPKPNFVDTSFLTGIDYGVNGPWRLRLLAGYEVRTFNSSVYKTIEAPIAEATVIYTPTGLTTLTGTVSRRIEDAADETTTGYTATAVQVAVDHEYLRNVLLHAQAAFSVNDYNRSSLSQRYYTAGASVTWLLNRNMRLIASYDFFARDTSNGSATTLGNGYYAGTNYTENRYMLRLGLNF